MHSIFSEEELDDKVLDMDGLGFTHHVSVEITSDNEESFLQAISTEIHKHHCRQLFGIHQVYSKLSQ